MMAAAAASFIVIEKIPWRPTLVRSGSICTGILGPDGSAATIRSTSILGARAAEPRTSRRSASSTEHTAQASTCASMVAVSTWPSLPCNRSGNASRTSTFVQSVIQELLHSAHGVVIMNPGRAFGRPDNFGDLSVRHALLDSQQEHLTLRGRQTVHCLSHLRFCFLRQERIERVVFHRRVGRLHLNCCALPLLRAPPVQHQPPLDREQPRSEGALSAKCVQRGKSPDERILHELLDLVPLPGACGEPRERVRMTGDERSCCPCIPRHPPLDQLSIGFSVAPFQGSHSIRYVRRPAHNIVKTYD